MHPLPGRRRTSSATITLLLALALLTVGMPVAAQPATQPPEDVPAGISADRLADAPLARPDVFDAPGAVPGEALVTYRDAAALQRDARSGWQSVDVTGFSRARALSDRVALVDVDADRTQQVVAALAADPDVVAVEPNMRREFAAVPADPSYTHQWAHRQTGAEQAWDSYTGAGPGQTAPLIAILDSGIDATHPDLSGPVVEQLQVRDGVIAPGTAQNDTCEIGHGTLVAGVAASQGDNDFGIAGVLWDARVIDVALTDAATSDCGRGPTDGDAIAAMHHLTARSEKPLVMNLSFGAVGTGCTAAYQAAADQARQAGIMVVAAAGNDGGTSTHVPASCPGILSVAASDADGQRASYSQQNAQVDITAPGGDIRRPVESCPSFDELVAQYVITTSLRQSSTVISGCPAYSDSDGHRLIGTSGTSFSAPYASAAVALLRQLAIDLGRPMSVDLAEAIVEDTATDAGPPGRDPEFGWGLLVLDAAVEAVEAGATPALQPDPDFGEGCPAAPSQSDSVLRFADADPDADAVCQAVAISSLVPGGQAPYAVLARADDFADALAGSAIGLGLGPLLYTSATGQLDRRTEQELMRVLRFEDHDPWVYIMGGSAAVPETVDVRLRELGITPVRLAGAGREATAVAAAQELSRITANVPFPIRDYAFVAMGRNWPDAVAAGQMAARYGIPILVTNTESLHPQTRDELQRLAPSQVYVLGGTGVISDTVVDEIDALGLSASRLAGGSRVDTALAVAGAYVDELGADRAAGEDVDQPVAVAVNLRTTFTDVLAASLFGGQGNVFLPLEGPDGSGLTDPVRERFCSFGGPLIVVGGTATISDAAADEAAAVVEGQSC